MMFNKIYLVHNAFYLINPYTFLTDLIVDESFYFHHFHLTIHDCQYFI